MPVGFSRRSFVCGLVASATAAERVSIAPSESRRFRDPATEFELTRLTDPEKSNCWLPAPPLRGLSRSDRSMVYCSDRSGSPQAWRMDLRSGESRQLTSAVAMVPGTLSVIGNDRAVVYFDGSALVLEARRPRVVMNLESGWAPTATFTVSDNGSRVAFAEKRENRYRLRAASINSGSSNVLLESGEPVRFVRFRSDKDGILYGHAGNLGLVSPDGSGNRTLKVEDGIVVDAQWSADGKVIHYLSAPREPRSRPVQLRDFNPESAEDKLVGSTTQFATFARNSDSSVFAGASSSKASPYILLLLRAARRELTVAEHRASDSACVVVAFSSNSQRLYYQTDRQGRAAIHVIGLDRFVEKTEISAATESACLLHPA